MGEVEVGAGGKRYGRKIRKARLRIQSSNRKFEEMK